MSTRRRRLLAIGVVLTAANVGWTLWCALDEPGSRPWPAIGAVVGVAIAFAIGAHMTPHRWHVRPWMIAAGLGPLLLLEPFAAGGRPLGYSNANGTLYAALALVWARTLVGSAAPHDHITRRWMVSFAGLSAVAVVLTGSWGAITCFWLGCAVAGVSLAVRRPWAAVPGAAISVALYLAIVGAFAAGAWVDDPAPDSQGVRVALWRVAVDELHEEPVDGIGPGRFAIVNPVSDDADLRRAHSAPLEWAAEQGAVGLALVLALPAFAIVWLWAAREEEPAAVAIGAAAVVTVCVHATFDWVASEPVITLLLAGLVGSASPRPRPRSVLETLGSLRLRP